jgi:hypothetical protein
MIRMLRYPDAAIALRQSTAVSALSTETPVNLKRQPSQTR